MIVKAVADAIVSRGLFSSGDRVLVAVSGGADSVAMLHILHALRGTLGIALVVTHYDHAFRRGSARDARFVRQMAAALSLPFVTEKRSGLRPRTGSLEEFAREQRYAFFGRALRRYKADKVAVAHTRDDLAETVLMRVIRGTGLSGLQAILPRRSLNGLMVVRPLLGVTRRDVERFLKQRKVSHVEDPTNASPDITRNRVRRGLIPSLEKNFGPGVRDNLARLAVNAGVDHDLIAGQAALIFSQQVRGTAHARLISSKAFLALHPALRREVLRMAYQAVRGDRLALTMRHVDDMDALARSGLAGTAIGLPGGLVFAKKNDVLLELKRLCT